MTTEQGFNDISLDALAELEGNKGNNGSFGKLNVHAAEGVQVAGTKDSHRALKQKKESEVEIWLDSEGHKSYFPLSAKNSYQFSNTGDVEADVADRISHHGSVVIGDAFSKAVTPEKQSQEKNNITDMSGDMDGNDAWPSFSMYDEKAYDVLDKKLLREAEAKQKVLKFAERFSVADIAENPELAMAAKLELGRASTADAHTMSVVESVASEAESRMTQLEQIRFTADSLDRDAAREVEAGMEDIEILIRRMDHGKRSCTQLFKLVQKLHQAELLYSRSLIAIAHTNISNVGSTENMKFIGEGIGELPMVIGEAHSKISCMLVESEGKLKSVLYNIKVVVEELVAEAQKISLMLSNKRNALSKALTWHENACKKLEDYWEVNSNTQSKSNKGPDPWDTEARVAHGYTQLIEGQIQLQKFLASSSEKVRTVENYRLDTTKSIVCSLMKSYGNVFQHSVQPFAMDILKMVEEMSIEEEMQDLNRRIREHDENSRSLERQCSEELALRYGDLFSSPDIVRQGELEIFIVDSGKWVKGHFVLTSCCLYWFMGSSPGPIPTDSLNLARSYFEQGEAPAFKIVQESENFFGFSRSVCLRALTVEDCCEWAISIREAISKYRSKK